MTYQEEEQARLKRQRSKQAIALAMQVRWREAVAANKDIIGDFPNDVDAYKEPSSFIPFSGCRSLFRRRFP